MPDQNASADGKAFRDAYENMYGTWRNEFAPHESDGYLPSRLVIAHHSGGFLSDAV